MQYSEASSSSCLVDITLVLANEAPEAELGGGSVGTEQ